VQGQLEGLVDKISKLPLEDIANNLNGSLSEMQKTLKQVNGEVLPQMHGALAQTQKTLDTVNSSFADDSPARQQISNAMDEVQRTARSVRVLSDFLSRNPEALIRGRTAQGKPDSYKASIHSSRDIEPEIQP
jgi:paraquat-inducible protein B